MTWTEDGKLVVFSGTIGFVSLYRTSGSADQPLATVQLPAVPASLSLSANGKRLAAPFAGGVCKVWNLVDGKIEESLSMPGQWRPKSGNQRSVPITDELTELLRSIPRRGQWVFCAPPSPGFPSLSRQISERRALVALKRLLKNLALPGKLHTFRHTFISQALPRGVPEVVVRQWVGHVDPEILRLYTHVADEVPQAYVSRFSGKSQAHES